MALYFSPKVDGKKNPCYLKVGKAGEAVGYSKSYSEALLARIKKQQNDLSDKVRESQTSIQKALADKKIDTDWVAKLLQRLGESNRQAFSGGKFIDSENPDPHASRIVLEHVSKFLNLNPKEEIDVNFKYDKLTDAELDDAIAKIGAEIVRTRGHAARKKA